MTELTPDVVGEDEVVCPCGWYTFAFEVTREFWPMRQVVCPSCGRILEALGG